MNHRNFRKFNRHKSVAILMATMVCAGSFLTSAASPSVYDMKAAKDYCDTMPLQDPEGIWIYPEDGVTVLITRIRSLSSSALPSYEITVVETSDIRLRPGDQIGTLTATPEKNKFEVTLFTERKNNLLLKPQTILAQLSDEAETLILKKEKQKFNLRFTFNPTTLLPAMWRIFRINTSAGNTSSTSPAVGMVKIYPSYDGNGSSRRQPRYL